MLAGGLGLTLLASCGSAARLPAAQFVDQARGVCARATSAIGRLPSPGPRTDDPLPNLVRDLLQWGTDTSVIVLVTPTATPDEVSAVRAAVARSGEVLRYRFLDQTAAKAQFDTIFAGTELVDSVVAGDLPASFNIVVRPKANVDSMVSRFSSQIGVQSVRTAREAVVPLVRTVRQFASRAAVIRSAEAERLGHLRPPEATAQAVDALVANLRAEAVGLRQVDTAAGGRDQQLAARIVAAAPGLTTRLSQAASRAGAPACGRSAWPVLMGAGPVVAR
ncbi:MAG: hypothetical protein QOJ09_883 [Actinomycetota bacterium]|nr:hypothetical protein [Actinomycetota bacterium]